MCFNFKFSPEIGTMKYVCNENISLKNLLMFSIFSVHSLDHVLKYNFIQLYIF